MLVIAIARFSGEQTINKPNYPIHRTVKYSFTVTNPNNHPVSNAELRVIAPVEQSPFQNTVSLESNLTFEIKEDDQGTKRMAFPVNNLAPFGSRNITITASVDLTDREYPFELAQSDDYLTDEKLIQISNPNIQRISKRLRSEDPRKTIEKIYNWMVANIKNSGYSRDDMGAVHALKKKSGDCTEFMYLFSALARANGIPTRNVAGFVVRENRILRPADYHNWNEAYIDGSWYIVDTDRQVFMEKPSEYIAMRFIGDGRSSQPMDSQNFFSSSNSIMVTMN